MRASELRFGLEFRGWMAELERLHWWVRAGYPLDPSTLSFEEMEALAMIARYRAVEDMRAQQPAVEE
ncbi:MAG: hypothetical protein KDC27_10410 [Acidobacteria bacterium]|nr:hypothetical protein [Acidobacteriota bacterium]